MGEGEADNTKAEFSRRSICKLVAASAIAGTARPVCGIVPDGELPSSSSTYTNPILGGDHPDPSAIRVGADYYLTHSSFVYSPGLVIWQSKDLIHWRAVSSALPQYRGNVWAPYLCEDSGRFYIYFPVDGWLFVVHAITTMC